jgi:glutamate--cysteine ligase
MSIDIDRESPIIESVEQLVEVFRSSETDLSDLRIGAEYERLAYVESTLAPVPYRGGISAILERLCDFGWQPVGNPPVALRRGTSSISLEPGGQLELSGAPYATVEEVATELRQHLNELRAAREPLGIGCTGMGLRPFERVADVPMMPRERFAHLKRYLPARGRRGLEMMFLTATVQANFDFVSEEDMAAKMRCAMGISPVIAATFANSPYAAGVWHGRRSERYAAWLDTDPDRCGLLDFVFDEDFGYRRYVEWLLDVPVMFLQREGRFVDIGVPFRTLLSEGVAGTPVTLGDFETHRAAVFPEVRLKNVIEVRGSDASRPDMSLANVALWAGLLYDDVARRAATDLTSHLSFAERRAMQIAAAQDGLGGHGRRWNMHDMARELYQLARAGLERSGGTAALLDPLADIVESGRTLADELIESVGAGPFEPSARRAILETGKCP